MRRNFLKILLASCIASNAFCVNTMAPGISLAYELIPNQTQTFANPLFYTLKAKCRITTADKSGDEFLVHVNKKSGSVNGISLAKNQGITINIKNDDLLEIVANGGAEVALTNKGKSSVFARCST